MIVTLDGPAGAGKSSTARALASRLGWCYMDTGAMYRAVALMALEQGIDLAAAERLVELAESLGIAFEAGGVCVNGRDISVEIRTERITQATRPVADAPPVRDAMKRIQRRMAVGIDLVTEGRDQGSVVFPQAELKVFLTASPEERARRRHAEELSRGRAVALTDVLSSQAQRDAGDRARPVGTLRPADDAVIIETDGLNRDDVVERLLALVAALQGSTE